MSRHKSSRSPITVSPGALAIVLISALVILLASQFGQQLFLRAFEGWLSILVVTATALAAAVCSGILAWRLYYGSKPSRLKRATRTFPRLFEKMGESAERRDISSTVRNGKLLARVGGEIALVAWGEWKASRLTMILAALLLALASELVLFHQLSVAREQRDLLARQNELFMQQTAEFRTQLQQTERVIALDVLRYQEAVLYSSEGSRAAPWRRVQVLMSEVEFARKHFAGLPVPVDRERPFVQFANLTDLDIVGPGALSGIDLDSCNCNGLRFVGYDIDDVHFSYRVRDFKSDSDSLSFVNSTLQQTLIPGWNKRFLVVNLDNCKCVESRVSAFSINVHRGEVQNEAQFASADNWDFRCQSSLEMIGVLGTNVHIRCEPVSSGGRVFIRNSRLNQIYISLEGASSAAASEVVLHNTSDAFGLPAVVKVDYPRRSGIKLEVEDMDVSSIDLSYSATRGGIKAGSLKNVRGYQGNRGLLEVDWRNCSADRDFVEWFKANSATPELAPSPLP